MYSEFRQKPGGRATLRTTACAILSDKNELEVEIKPRATQHDVVCNEPKCYSMQNMPFDAKLVPFDAKRVPFDANCRSFDANSVPFDASCRPLHVFDANFGAIQCKLHDMSIFPTTTLGTN